MKFPLQPFLVCTTCFKGLILHQSLFRYLFSVTILASSLVLRILLPRPGRLRRRAGSSTVTSFSLTAFLRDLLGDFLASEASILASMIRQTSKKANNPNLKYELDLDELDALASRWVRGESGEMFSEFPVCDVELVRTIFVFLSLGKVQVLNDFQQSSRQVGVTLL